MTMRVRGGGTMDEEGSIGEGLDGKGTSLDQVELSGVEMRHTYDEGCWGVLGAECETSSTYGEDMVEGEKRKGIMLGVVESKEDECEGV